MKFSALNVDFDSPDLDFLASRKLARMGVIERYPRKSRYFTIVGQSFVHIGMGTLLITTSNSDKLFSHININDFERP